MPIAQKLADRGEKGRAIVTVLNALRYNPQFFDATPSPIDFIAQHYVPGFEEELSRLQTIYPQFGELLSAAFYRIGKPETALYLHRHFEAYCVNQMKMAHATYGDHNKRDNMPRSGFSADLAYSASPCTQREARDMLGNVHRLTHAAQPPRSSATFRRIAQASASDGYVGITRISPDTPQPSDPLTHADKSLMFALETGIPEMPASPPRPLATSMEFDGVRIPLTDDLEEQEARILSMASLELPSAIEPNPKALLTEHPIAHAPATPLSPVNLLPSTWQPPQAPEHAFSLDTDFISQIALTSVARRRNKPLPPSPEPTVHPRFERMRSNSALSEQPQDVFVEDATQRVILDFDNQIGNSLMSGGQQTSKELTPYRTFDQELAEFLASPLNTSNINIHVVCEDPFDKVAAVSHALKEETPSVTPYAPTPSKTFSISSAQLSVCVAMCVIFVLGLITWKASEPDLAKEAIRDLGTAYLAAAQEGVEDPIHTLKTNEAVLTKPFTDAFQKFFAVWQAIYFATPQPAAFDETIDIKQPCEVTAKLLWLTHQNRHEEAQALFSETPSDTWRGAEYFKRFSEALMAELEHAYPTAAQRYARLVNSPISGFAITRLAHLALYTDHPEVRSIYAKLSWNPEEPVFSQCVRAILTQGAQGGDPVWHFEMLSPEFEQICTIGTTFRRMHEQLPIPLFWRDKLAQMKADSRLEPYRMDALIESAMQSGDIQTAAHWFASYQTTANHPDKTRFLHDIMQRAFDIDKLDALHQLDSKIRPDLTIFEAARILDTGEADVANTWAEYYVRYGARRPTHIYNESSYQTMIDHAWEKAVAGDYANALNILRTIRGRHPDAWEPLMLQAEVLYHTGRGKDAAGVYELRALHEEGRAVAMVMSNLYRIRSGLSINTMAYGLFWIGFNDPMLENGRCEILEHMAAEPAKTCREQLNKRKFKRPVKALWLDRQGSRSNPYDLANAGAGAISTPGFHKRLAQRKVASGAVRDGVKSYLDAILNDPTTATPETVAELEAVFETRKRRYEGSHTFEALIPKLYARSMDNHVIAAAHHAAAAMYQPANGSSQAKQHYLKAIELIGDHERAIRGIMRYYETKDKPEQLSKWKARFRALEDAP